MKEGRPDEPGGKLPPYCGPERRKGSWDPKWLEYPPQARLRAFRQFLTGFPCQPGGQALLSPLYRRETEVQREPETCRSSPRITWLQRRRGPEDPSTTTQGSWRGMVRCGGRLGLACPPETFQLTSL